MNVIRENRKKKKKKEKQKESEGYEQFQTLGRMCRFWTSPRESKGIESESKWIVPQRRLWKEHEVRRDMAKVEIIWQARRPANWMLKRLHFRFERQRMTRNVNDDDDDAESEKAEKKSGCGDECVAKKVEPGRTAPFVRPALAQGQSTKVVSRYVDKHEADANDEFKW